MSEVRREDEMLAEAKKKGLVIVYPKPNQLFIDIDDAAGLAAFERNFPMFREMHPVIGEPRKTPSPSGKPFHFHITIDLEEPISDETRIYWQALLGSDLTREMLALRHLKDGIPRRSSSRSRSLAFRDGPAIIVGEP